MMEEFVHMQILEHRWKQPYEVGFVTPKHTLPVLPDPASCWPISLGALMLGPWSHLCQYMRCAWNPLDRHVNKHSQMKLVCTWARRKLLSMPNQLDTYLSLKKSVLYPIELLLYFNEMGRNRGLKRQVKQVPRWITPSIQYSALQWHSAGESSYPLWSLYSLIFWTVGSQQEAYAFWIEIPNCSFVPRGKLPLLT